MSTEAADVLVIGGGNAGIVAALTAAQAGRGVVLLERAPAALRGGNSKYTRNIRCVQSDAVIGEYSEEEFLADLLSIGGPEVNATLTRLLVAESCALPR